MEPVSTKELASLIRDIVWRFGARGLESQCCRGLSSPEVRALRIASEQRQCSMQEIAGRLGFTKSGVTRVVDRLEKRGLVQRMRSPEDGRVCCVEVAASGKTFIATVNQENEQRIDKILSKIDPAMQHVVQTSLQSFVQAMKEEG